MLNLHLNRNLIFINPPVSGKENLFQFFAEKAQKEGYLNNADHFVDAIINRESKASNLFAPGIVIPHSRSSEVKRQFVGICIFNDGFEYMDMGQVQVVKIVFIIGSTKENPSYLALYADISRLLHKKGFVERLGNADVPADVLQAVSNHSIQEFAGQTKKEAQYRIILTLNKDFDEETLAEILLESGIRCVVESQAQNFYSKTFNKIPFISFQTLSMLNQHSTTKIIRGITDDKDAINKIYLLLKDEGINLDEPGIGSLTLSEVQVCFGAIDDPVDF